MNPAPLWALRVSDFIVMGFRLRRAKDNNDSGSDSDEDAEPLQEQETPSTGKSLLFTEMN